MKYLRKFQTEAEYDKAQKLLAKSYVSLIADTGALKYDKGIPAGVYIQHIDGALYTTTQWSTSGFANEEANGVAVIDDAAHFVVAKTRIMEFKYWSSSGEEEKEGILSTRDMQTAQKDYNGKANTAIIVATDISEAAYCCVNYEFPNGQRGYLPSVGEWEIVAKWRADIEAANVLVGGSEFLPGYYWSSTQYNPASFAWVFNGKTSGLTYEKKTTIHRVHPFTTL